MNNTSVNQNKLFGTGLTAQNINTPDFSGSIPGLDLITETGLGNADTQNSPSGAAPAISPVLSAPDADFELRLEDLDDIPSNISSDNIGTAGFNCGQPGKNLGLYSDKELYNYAVSAGESDAEELTSRCEEVAEEIIRRIRNTAIPFVDMTGLSTSYPPFDDYVTTVIGEMSASIHNRLVNVEFSYLDTFISCEVEEYLNNAKKNIKNSLIADAVALSARDDDSDDFYNDDTDCESSFEGSGIFGTADAVCTEAPGLDALNKLMNGYENNGPIIESEGFGNFEEYFSFTEFCPLLKQIITEGIDDVLTYNDLAEPDFLFRNLAEELTGIIKEIYLS